MGLFGGRATSADVEVLCSAVPASIRVGSPVAGASRRQPASVVRGDALGRDGHGRGRRLARAGGFVDDHRALAEVWARGVMTSEHVHAPAVTPIGSRSRRCRRPSRAGPVVGSPAHGSGELRGACDPGPGPTPRSRARRGSRGRWPVPLLRPDRRLGRPVRRPARLEGEAVIARRGLRRTTASMPTTSRHRRAGSMGRWLWSTPPMPRGLSPCGVGCPSPCRSPWTRPPSAKGCGPPPRAHLHGRRAAPHRRRCAGHPGCARHRAVPGHGRGVPRGHRSGGGRGQRRRHGAALGRGSDRLPGHHPARDRIRLAVGRSARTDTPAQRRALAARDRGCIIPGCGIPAEACQTHHVEDWPLAVPPTSEPRPSVLGRSRQVDLGMSTIVAATEDDGYANPSPKRHLHPLARQQRRTLDHHPTPRTCCDLRRASYRTIIFTASTTSTSPRSS